jgi:hypothetical protein
MNFTLRYLVNFACAVSAVWMLTIPAALYNQASAKELAETAGWGVLIGSFLALVIMF